MTKFAFLLTILFITVVAAKNEQPQLLKTESNCIKKIVLMFTKQKECSHLNQKTKSKLALEMTNCLLIQMGKAEKVCQENDPMKCQMEGDLWNTFTNFFTHIDNLCHFYWEISQSERTQDMISALKQSLTSTEKTLGKNLENTEKIIQLHQNLHIKLLQSLTTQEELHKIVSKSSNQLKELFEKISFSLEGLDERVNKHYRRIVEVLEGIGMGIEKISLLQSWILGEIGMTNAIGWWGGLLIFILVLSTLFDRIKLKRKQISLIVGSGFLIEWLAVPICKAWFPFLIESYLNTYRLLVGATILLMSLTSRKKADIQHSLQSYLNTARIKRIMSKVLQEEEKLGVQKQ